MWDEVSTAQKENRRELVLSGKNLVSRLEATHDQLDPSIFKLINLNFLDLSSCPKLSEIPQAIGNLTNLTSLVMNRNDISAIPGPAIEKLSKLKVLDLSANKIEVVPSQLCQLDKLTTLNLSMNGILSMPSLTGNSSLSHLDLSSNKINSIDFLCLPGLSYLADVSVAKNAVEVLPPDVAALQGSLKKLDLSENKIKVVPGELASCSKLKDLNLKENPISDNRLKKMVAQKGTKAVLDYVKSNCPLSGQGGGGGAKDKKKGGKGKGSKGTSNDAVEEAANLLDVLHMREESPQIVVEDIVKDVRPYIVCCIVRNVNLAGDNFKKFIRLQTKLHDTVCDKRNAATIATHDLSKIPPGPLTYTALSPKSLKIVPLGKEKDFDAEQLVDHLKEEAESVKAEKKRNNVSGIHRYLNLLKDKEHYACVTDSNGRIVSFPPITNSEGSKICEETTNVLVEVTSTLKLQTAKDVADALLREMLYEELGEAKNVLSVEQVKLVDNEGNLKVVYPSKTDLNFADASGGKKIVVKRQ